MPKSIPTAGLRPSRNITVAVPRPDSLHVAIIMDGNGRWAETRGLPRYEGHRVGAEVMCDEASQGGLTGLPGTV